MATFAINGRQPHWAVMRVTIPQLGKRTVSIQAITYSHAWDKVLIHGEGADPIGSSRDVYMPGKCTIEMLVAEADYFRSLMGPGYFQYKLDFSVSYEGDGVVNRTDTIFGWELTTETPNATKGSDAHKVTWEGQPERIVLNGVQPTIPRP